ncbi:MAG: hypothetical protein NTU98_02870 [Bacteroidetes bacterium]|nr:hypothetical protein [Bacteroidota bacterium]
MSDRKKIPEWIDRFNNGELSGKELTSFLEMAQRDPRLSEEIRLDKELDSILTDEDLLELRAKIRSISDKKLKTKRNRRKFYLMAASFLLLAGLGLLLFYFRGIRNSNVESSENETGKKKVPPAEQMQAIQKKNPAIASLDTGNNISIEQKNKILLASFEKNPSYENLIGATRDAGNFRMVFPLIGHRFSISDVIQFEWELDNSDVIKLQLFNNKGIAVHQTGNIGTNRYSIQKSELKRGLYYFIILHGEDILYFGKFTIE